MRVTRSTTRRNLTLCDESAATTTSLSSVKAVLKNKKNAEKISKKSIIEPKVQRAGVFHSPPLVNLRDSFVLLSMIDQIKTKHTGTSTARILSGNTQDTQLKLTAEKVRKLSDPCNLENESTLQESSGAEKRKLCDIFKQTCKPKTISTEHDSPQSTSQSGKAPPPHLFSTKNNTMPVPEKKVQKEPKKRAQKSKNKKLTDKAMVSKCEEIFNKTKNQDIEDNNTNIHYQNIQKENQGLNILSPQKKLDSEDNITNNFNIPSGMHNKGIDLRVDNSLMHKRRKRRSYSKHYTDNDTCFFPSDNGMEQFQWASRDLEFVGEPDKIRIKEVLSNSTMKSGYIEIDIGGSKPYTTSKLYNIDFTIIEGSAELEMETILKSFTKREQFSVRKGAPYAIRNIGQQILLMEFLMIRVEN